MNIGLFFGSFNPVHNGHLTIAQTMVNSNIVSIEEVWFVISPQNPLKNTKSLLPVEHRLFILETALRNKEYLHCKICDVELHLPQPSYTIDTLRVLHHQHPEKHFSIIIGEDCLTQLPLWKDFTELSQKYSFVVYPRTQKPLKSTDYPFVKVLQCPLLPVSSTQIRENIQQELPIDDLVPSNCIALIYYVIGLQLWQYGQLPEAYNAINKAVEKSNGEVKFSEALLLLQQILNFEKTVPETF